MKGTSCVSLYQFFFMVIYYDKTTSRKILFGNESYFSKQINSMLEKENLLHADFCREKLVAVCVLSRCKSSICYSVFDMVFAVSVEILD